MKINTIQKCVLSFSIGVLLMGVGLAISFTDFTDMELTTYIPTTQFAQSEEIIYPLTRDIITEVIAYNSIVTLETDKSLPLNEAKFIVEYPRNATQFYHYINSDNQIYFHTNINPTLVWDTMQKGLAGLKEKQIAIPDLQYLNTKITVMINPLMEKYITTSSYERNTPLS